VERRLPVEPGGADDQLVIPVEEVAVECQLHIGAIASLNAGAGIVDCGAGELTGAGKLGGEILDVEFRVLTHANGGIVEKHLEVPRSGELTAAYVVLLQIQFLEIVTLQA